MGASRTVYKRTQSLPRLVHPVSTGCAQVLDIEFLPDFCDLLTDEEVELDRLFDLFDRVDCGSMILSAELCCDLWEAEVKFAPEQVHRDLARDDDMLIALFTADFF